MKKLLALLLLLSMVLFPGLAADNEKAVMQEANELYRTGQYQEALEKYQYLRDEGYQSKALFYNLGNTFYKLGNKGQCVLQYERATILDPTNPQLKEDLAFVKSQLSDEIIPLDVFPLIRVWQNIQKTLSANSWTWLAMLLFWLALAGGIIWVLVPSRKHKKMGFFFGLGLLALCIIPFSMAIGKKKMEANPQIAVVLIPDTPLKSAPAAGSETTYMLFEGATLNTIDSLQEWKKVSLANGYQGWVNTNAIEAVK